MASAEGNDRPGGGLHLIRHWRRELWVRSSRARACNSDITPAENLIQCTMRSVSRYEVREAHAYTGRTRNTPAFPPDLSQSQRTEPCSPFASYARITRVLSAVDSDARPSLRSSVVLQRGRIDIALCHRLFIVLDRGSC